MMPSNLPSSFASAAAGQTSTRDGRSNSRSDTRGSGDWNRRDGRSTNGTLTFRRSSTTPSLAGQAFSQAATDPIPPSVDVPPSASALQHAFDMSMSPTAYSRDQLFDIYKTTEHTPSDVERLFVSGWNPGQPNGSHSARWTKSADHAPQEPDLCWDHDGSVHPMGLQELSPVEREVFSTDVNSTMKPPQPKDGTHPAGLNGRKPSISHSSSNFGLISPTSATRLGPRRRETTDTNPFSPGSLTSPSANRSFSSRDEASYWLSRPRTDGNNPATVEESVDGPNQVGGATSSGNANNPGGIKAHQQGQPPQTISTKSSFPFSSTGRGSTGGGGMISASSIWGASPTSATASQAAMGSFGNFSMPSSDKPKFARQESRFANIIGTKESSENVRQDAAASQGPSSATATADPGRSWRPRPRTDTDPFGVEDGGPAANRLPQHQENSPPLPQGTSGPPFDTPQKGSAGDFGMSGLNIGSHGDSMPLSPSETNPYRSPDRGPLEEEASAENPQSLGPRGEQPPSGFTTLPRSFAPGGFDGSDRSQTSSTGPAKGLGGFGGSLGGWPSSAAAAGTPDRERQFSAFGGGVFGPSMGDIHSPSIGAGLGGGVFGGPGPMPGTGSLRGASKLGSLFPAAMQAQMQSQDLGPEGLGDSVADNPMGSIGRSAAAAFGRESDSPMRSSRNVFDIFTNPDIAKQAPIGTQAPGAPGGTVPAQDSSAAPGSNADDTPSTQVRQMVMPDRMRWVYLDPQGNTQGPFTGLEMNDWYKGNFFSPDLRIKKLEDADFEPLGHLIRRIGNSREPFLVPQVGLPHGPPTQPYTPGNTATGVVPPLPNAFPQFGRVLPADEQNNLERRKQEEQLKMARQRDYFAQQQAMTKIGMGSVGGALQHHSSAHSLQSQPSFGSVSSPIGMPPQAPIGAGMPPSSTVAPATNDFFGMTNTGAPQPPEQPGMGGSSLNIFLDENPGALTLDECQILADMQASQAAANRAPGPQQTASAVAPGASTLPATSQPDPGLRSQLPRTDQLEDDSQGFSARLREFEQYQARNAGEVTQTAPASSIHRLAEAESQPPAPIASGPTPPTVIPTVQSGQERKKAKKIDSQSDASTSKQTTHIYSLEDQLSLTQQVQKAQAAKQSAQDQQVWVKPQISGLPMPFPPPSVQSGTPLPAPTAQRTPSTLPDQYANRSQSETPDNAAPQSATSQAPPAPWAPEISKGHKGPSLKEIQEAESRKAAKRGEVVAAQRRLAIDQETAAIREREKAAAGNAGLPTSSTWGHSSPVGGASTNIVPTAWTKPGATKGVVSVSENQGPKKKTLADIQREEEARKKKTSMQQTGGGGGGGIPGGKLYAHLASKQGQPAPGLAVPIATAQNPSSAAGGGWTTVSAGGKPKLPPTGPASLARPVGAATIKTTPLVVKTVARSTTKDPKSDTVNTAMDEFKKWVDRELKRDVNNVVNISEMTATLMGMPIDDSSLIQDIIYQSSTTMDARHFAEEFIRRKKLALKGVVERSALATESAKNAPGGGWNEVAKKGGGHTKSEVVSGADIMQNANFKIVTGRKKGGKK